MKIAFYHKGKAYLPELVAYREYLGAKGFETESIKHAKKSLSVDLEWHFMGQQLLPRKTPVIHEYASMSMGGFGYIKDKIKRRFNVQPTGRVFLNKFIASSMKFSDGVPNIYRDMGVSKNFYSVQPFQSKPQFDLVYVGDMSPVRQIGHFLSYFCKHATGCRLLLIGEPNKELLRLFGSKKCLEFAGKLNYQDIPDAARAARLGLNYLPLKLPYLHQTSTKVLEYCALGMGVISVATPWVENFFHSREGCYLPISDKTPFLTPDILDNFNPVVPEVSDLEWNTMFDRIGLVDWLKRVVNQSD